MPAKGWVIMNDARAGVDMTSLLGGHDPIATFAGRVLDVLVDRSRRAGTTMRRDLVIALADGMVTQDEARIQEALRGFRRACISPSAMADNYVPEAARLLGLSWAQDRMEFSEVTIATARLQALVRAIGTRWDAAGVAGLGRPSILMVVPQGQDHTLGAVVATGRLRRMGYSVCLRLGPTRREVAQILRDRVFDAAMLSIGHGERLDVSRDLVGTIRAASPRAMPILAGGAAEIGKRDLADWTGVDLVTSDLDEALLHCGLSQLPVAPAGAGDARSVAMN